MAIFNTKKSSSAQVEADNSNIIGKGTMITGDIKTFGNIRIDGELTGNITSQSKIALGEGSHVTGNIYSQNAEIAGTIVGDLYITDQLTLKPTASIVGNIYSLRLVVESGAKIEGKLKVGEEPKIQPDTASSTNSPSNRNGKTASATDEKNNNKYATV